MNVADFAGAAARAVQYAPVIDVRASDTGTNGQAQRCFGASRIAGMIFGETRTIHVVFDFAGQAGLLFDHRFQWGPGVARNEFAGVSDAPRGAVDHARCGYADAV